MNISVTKLNGSLAPICTANVTHIHNYVISAVVKGKNAKNNEYQRD